MVSALPPPFMKMRFRIAYDQSVKTFIVNSEKNWSYFFDEIAHFQHHARLETT